MIKQIKNSTSIFLKHFYVYIPFVIVFIAGYICGYYEIHRDILIYLSNATQNKWDTTMNNFIFVDYSSYDQLFSISLFVLTVSIGCVTYSISFLWNAYKDILDIGAKAGEKSIDSILNKYFYHKALILYKNKIKLPYFYFVIIGFILLPLHYFIYPKLNIIFGVIFLIAFIYYVYKLPDIFSGLLNQSKKSLKEFIESKEIEKKDEINLFDQLWKLDDAVIQKEFNLNLVDLQNNYIKYVDSNIQLSFRDREHARDLLNIYHINLNNRETLKLLLRFYDDKSFFTYLLKWHFLAWKYEYESLQKESNEYTEYEMYDDLYRIVKSILDSMVKTTLQTRHSYQLFKELKSHIEFHQNEMIGNNSYLDSFKSIFRLLFDEITDSSESYDIWEHYFPKEWLINTNNIDLNKISFYIYNLYLEWAHEHINKSDSTKYNKNLDWVTRGLFPSADPIYWSNILTFALRSYSTGHRLSSLVNSPPGFGYVSQIFFGSKSGKDTLRDDYSETQENAIDIALKHPYLRRHILDNIDNTITSLEKMIDDEEYIDNKERVERLIDIFKRINEKYNN